MNEYFNYLPEIKFAERDPELILNSVISTYEEVAGYKLAPGDPRRLFLQSLGTVIVQQRYLIDRTGKMNLLPYSEGDYLDHIGTQVGVDRLLASPAQTTLEFTLATVRKESVLIPLGTRVAATEDIVFHTTKAVTILPGQLSIIVDAESITSGVSGNGFLPGQVTKIVDLISGVKEAKNITTTEGGADDESDERYQIRIHEAPESFSVAGPIGAYRFFAKSASALIDDVLPYSPEPGVMEVRPLLINGVIPGVEILQEVEKALVDRERVPQTDKVNVLAPNEVKYPVEVTYWIGKEKREFEQEIILKVQDAIDEYVLWQRSKIGRDLNPDKMRQLIISAGAKRAVIPSPIYKVIPKISIATTDENYQENVAYGGLEDD